MWEFIKDSGELLGGGLVGLAVMFSIVKMFLFPRKKEGVTVTPTMSKKERKKEIESKSGKDLMKDFMGDL